MMGLVANIVVSLLITILLRPLVIMTLGYIGGERGKFTWHMYLALL